MIKKALTAILLLIYAQLISFFVHKYAVIHLKLLMCLTDSFILELYNVLHDVLLYL